jgi:hypothetical protein
MFHDVTSMRLSQFNSDTEKSVPCRFKECSYMKQAEDVKEAVMGWLNGLVADFCDEGLSG